MGKGLSPTVRDLSGDPSVVLPLVKDIPRQTGDLPLTEVLVFELVNSYRFSTKVGKIVKSL